MFNSILFIMGVALALTFTDYIGECRCNGKKVPTFARVYTVAVWTMVIAQLAGIL